MEYSPRLKIWKGNSKSTISWLKMEHFCIDLQSFQEISIHSHNSKKASYPKLFGEEA